MSATRSTTCDGRTPSCPWCRSRRWRRSGRRGTTYHNSGRFRRAGGCFSPYHIHHIPLYSSRLQQAMVRWGSAQQLSLHCDDGWVWAVWGWAVPAGPNTSPLLCPVPGWCDLRRAVCFPLPRSASEVFHVSSRGEPMKVSRPEPSGTDVRESAVTGYAMFRVSCPPSRGCLPAFGPRCFVNVLVALRR